MGYPEIPQPRSTLQITVWLPISPFNKLLLGIQRTDVIVRCRQRYSPLRIFSPYAQAH